MLLVTTSTGAEESVGEFEATVSGQGWNLTAAQRSHLRLRRPLPASMSLNPWRAWMWRSQGVGRAEHQIQTRSWGRLPRWQGSN